MTVLQRIATHFVAPAAGDRSADAVGTEPQARPAVVAAAPTIAVLCPPADATALGSALALAVARERRAACALVGLWTGGAPSRPAWHAPALPAARRLVANLGRRGQEARAAGRLALVRLPADGEEAASMSLRAAAAAGSAPTVLALGGPRTAAFDALLEAQDLVVVATPDGADPALARLAVAGLAAYAVPARPCALPSAPPARVLAAAGLALLPSARRALAAPLEALS